MITISTLQQVEDLTRGLCFFATGGGGDPRFGQKMLCAALEAGKNIRIVDMTTLDDEDWTICPYLMGSSGPEMPELIKAKQACGLTHEKVVNMPAAAVRLLLQQAQVKLSAIIPLELGGAATASAIAAAAWLDVPVIDGDYAGRAVPEISQILPAIHGINLFPIASSDVYGNETIIHNAINQEMAERIGKYIASASFGLIGQAALLLKVNVMKSLILSHTLSKALTTGETIRRAREAKQNIIQPISKLTQAKILFKGQVAEYHADELEGYYVGYIIFTGIDEFKHKRFKIWFKNENLISWLNDQPCVTSPDLLAIVDQSTWEPTINSQLTKGENVIIFGIPSKRSFRTKRALEVLGPRHFGFEFDTDLMQYEE